MKKSVAKASYFDASYQRRNHHGRKPTLSSLKAAMEELGALTRRPLVDSNNIGIPTAYGGHSKPYTDLNIRGIPPTLPTFDGQTSSSLDLWLCEIKCYFLKQYTPELKKCELVVSCLRGDALLWYKLLELTRIMEGKGKISSWSKLESYMKKEFASPCAMSKPEAITQTSLKMISPHNNLNPSVCKKSLTRKKIKCFLCQGVGHLRKDCPSTKTSLETICSNDNIPEVTDNVEKRVTNTIKNENLLVENSLMCVETVKNGAIEYQSVEQSCLDVIVKDHKCVTPGAQTNPVERPCKTVSYLNGAYTDEDLNLTELMPMIDVCMIEHLHTTEVELVNVPSLEKKGMNPVFVPSIEKEPDHTSMVPFDATHIVPIPVLSTYVSPLDLYIHKRLHRPLSNVVGHYVTMLEGKKSWNPNANKPNEYTPFICSKLQNFKIHTKNYPNPNHNHLSSPKCAVSMPHFHSYMLRNMQTNLIQLGVIPYISETRTDQEACNTCKLPWSHLMKCFEEFVSLNYYSWNLFVLIRSIPISEMRILGQLNLRLIISNETTPFRAHCPSLKCLLSGEEIQSLESHCYVMNELGKGLLVFEMSVPRNPGRKPPVYDETNQIKHHCPILNSLCLGMNNVPSVCEEMLRATNSSSSLSANGFLTPLVKSLLRNTPQHSRNSSLVFDPGISKDTWVSTPSEIGTLSTPEPSHQGTCYGLGSEESRRIKEEHKGPCGPLSCLGFLIKVWVWLRAAYLTWKVAWLFMVIVSLLNILSSGSGSVICIPTRPFLLVFDPGGRSQKEISVHQSYYWNFKKGLRNFSFNYQSLRTNFLQPGEVEVNARGIGHSLFYHVNPTPEFSTAHDQTGTKSRERMDSENKECNFLNYQKFRKSVTTSEGHQLSSTYSKFMIFTILDS